MARGTWQVDQQCVQRLYTSDRTFRQLLRNQALTDVQEVEGEAAYLAACAQSKTYASSGPANPRDDDGIVCEASEDAGEMARLLDAALGSLDKLLGSISPSEVRAGRERLGLATRS